MNNLEKWANTMELLHDVEPAPFFKNYDVEKAQAETMRKKFMLRVRHELSKLATEDNYEILDKIDDLCFVYSCAVNSVYNYSIKDGKINHTTEKGQKLADIFNK